jgi:hypothetical protein
LTRFKGGSGLAKSFGCERPKPETAFFAYIPALKNAAFYPAKAFFTLKQYIEG